MPLRSSVPDAVLIALTLALLLGLEWRYRRRRLRVGAVLLALAVLAFYGANYTGARRRALAMPPAERVTMSPVAGSEGRRLSEYDSGVYTAMRTVGEAHAFGASARLAAVGALVWLACSPAFRRPTAAADRPGARPDPGRVAPEA